MSQRAHKGKGRDRSTAWSDWQWDNRGFYVCSRLNAAGELEYDYSYLEETQNLQQQAIPRSSGRNYGDGDKTSLPTYGVSPSYVTPSSTASKSNYGPEPATYQTASSSSDADPMYSSCTSDNVIPRSSATYNTYRSDIYTTAPTTAGGQASNYGTYSKTSGYETLGVGQSLPAMYGDPQYIRGDETSKGRFGDRFEVIENPSGFFKVGRVFKVHWSEPAGNVSSDEGPFVATSSYNQNAFTKVRHFVVVQENQGFSLCLPLNTYNGQGATKQGIRVQDYAAVYPANGEPPLSRANERMVKEPFPILVEEKGEKIDSTSRLNFGRVYTVEHNVKVAKVGRIPDEYLPLLRQYFVLAIAAPQGLTQVNQSYASSGRTSEIGGMDWVTGALQGLSVASSSYAETSSPSLDNSGSDLEFQKIELTFLAGYRVIPDRDLKRFWRVGRVFAALWTEPTRDFPSGFATSPSPKLTTTYLGGTSYSEIRRFVVVQENWGNSLCCPINTYSGMATLKPNLPDVQQHAIIYTSSNPPKEYCYTAANGSIVRENLTKEPIKVRSEQTGPDGDLGELSRLNYSKIYTVEQYIRVLNIGMVEDKEIPTLLYNSPVKPRDSPVERPRKYPPAERSAKSKGKGTNKFDKEYGRR